MNLRALALLAILACGAAEAAARTPYRLDAAFPEGVFFEGSVVAEAAEGILDLAPALEAHAPVRVSWASARGWMVEGTLTKVGGDPPVTEWSEPSSNRSLEFGPGAIETLRCDGACQAIAYVDASEGGVFRLTGERASVAETGARSSFRSGPDGPGATDAFFHEAPAAWLAPRLADGSAGALVAAGSVSLFLYGASGEIVAGGEREAFATGNWSEPLLVAGIPAGRVVTIRFMVLTLTGAEVAPPSHAPLYAPSLDARHTGALDAPAAEGALVAGGETIDLAGRRVRIEGEGAALLRGSASGLLAAEPLAQGSASGDATRIVVGGARVAADRAGPPVVAIATAAATLAVLAAILLYSRLRREDILAQPTRARVYAQVRTAPGTSVRGLARALDLPLMVVRHHIRVLENGGFVVTRLARGERGCFAADAAENVRWAGPTRGTRARIVALLAERPRTRQDLARELQLSERLVGYHLGRLREDGLVAAGEGRPSLHYARAEETRAPSKT